MTDSTTSHEPSIDELQAAADEANKRLAKARQREHERRTLGQFRDEVRDYEKQHDDLIERQTSYNTDSKARLFGFGAFSGKNGEALWILAGSIFAVERDPNETFTIVKTAAEPIGVLESPDDVFNELTRIRFEGSAESVRENQAELARREEKVREGTSHGETPNVDAEDSGPDFKTVSDLVGIDIDDEDDLDFPDYDSPRLPES